MRAAVGVCHGSTVLLLLCCCTQAFAPVQPTFLATTNFTSLLLEIRHSQGVERHLRLLDSDGDSQISAAELQRALRGGSLAAAKSSNDPYLSIQGGLEVHRELLKALRKAIPEAERGTCPQCPIDSDSLAALYRNPFEQIPGQYAQEEWEDAVDLSETACFPPVKDQGRPLWEGTAVPGRMRQRCDIPMELISSLTPADFKRKYFDPGKPVIVRNASHGWPATSLWANRTALLDAYGGKLFRTGFKPPLMETRETLSKFMAYMAKTSNPRPRYLWDEAMRQGRYGPRQRHPIEDAEIPALISELAKGAEGSRYGIGAASFTAGPACSGAQFHRHSQAFNVLVFGLKYWVLVPPAEGDGDDDAMIPEPILRYLRQETGEGDLKKHHPRDVLQALEHLRGKTWWKGKTPNLLECVQQEGDMIFLPRDYGHLVLNMWPSVAVNSHLDNDGEIRAHIRAAVRAPGGEL